MKIIHLADIHWRGLSRHEEYRESFSYFFQMAKELQPDIIYVGGDIVHSKTQGISPELIDCLCWWFEGLSDIAPTHVILGNHDGLVFNKDRQDAITPIITALDNPNIYLYKDSGVYPVKGHENFNWCVFSCFDEEKWECVKPDPDKINLALFHGAVWGSKTDIDFSIEGDVTDDFFDQFDFTLLGDIHRRQFLNDEKTMAYPGSSIQQNYGEDTGKGFLFWDIREKDDFDVKFFEIPHLKPFVTLDWAGSVDDVIDKSLDYPDGSRFRIRSKSLLFQSDSKRLQYDLKREKSATEVVFKSDSTFDASKIQTTVGPLRRESLRDSKTHKKLIRDFYEESELDDDLLQKFDNLIEKYVSQISSDQDVLRNSRWHVNSFKFDNLFVYGPDNVVNFENLPGITGIFGKNTKGKSSIIGALMYGLFNTTDRGPIKNLHIINSRKNSCSAEVSLSINGELFKIKRSTVKHETRKGEIYASTSLNLHKISDDGETEDVTEEQRRETEKVLRRMIGTADDFLMTSLASQGEMNTFIKEGATSRKMILTKFLDLEVFEKMYETAKLESSDIRNKSRLYPDIDWDEEIDNFQFDVDENKRQLISTEKDINQKRQRLRELSIQLAMSENPDIVTKAEVNAHQKIIDEQARDVVLLKEKRNEFQNQILEKEKKIDRIKFVKLEFPINELLGKREAQKNLEKSMTDLGHAYDTQRIELERQELSISKLDEVPCGNKFPSCKFIKDSHEDSLKIDIQIGQVEKSLSLLNDVKSSLKLILRENIEEKILKYESIIKNESKLSIDVSRLQVKLNNSINELNTSTLEMEKSQEILEDMMVRVVDDDSNCGSSSIKSSIISLENEIKKLDKSRLRKVEKIAGLKSEISRMKSDRKEFDDIKKSLLAYDLFMQATSKKGIPLHIMMSQLPLINLEISKILQGVTGFTVELDANPDSNSMDVYINYGDSRRIIELASGMEKMMASLAIRAALINISSLTKTNMLIIDEGFGALDENNIEACTRLLSSLKKWFKHILVISHVDAIKDAVDNTLEIVKNEKDAKVFNA